MEELIKLIIELDTVNLNISGDFTAVTNFTNELRHIRILTHKIKALDGTQIQLERLNDRAAICNIIKAELEKQHIHITAPLVLTDKVINFIKGE